MQHLTADIGETIMFNASGDFRADDENLSVTWDFDDGTTATGPSAQHSFGAPGAYRITLTVSHGTDSSTAAVTITVHQQGGNGPGP